MGQRSNHNEKLFLSGNEASTNYLFLIISRSLWENLHNIHNQTRYLSYLPEETILITLGMSDSVVEMKDESGSSSQTQIQKPSSSTTNNHPPAAVSSGSDKPFTLKKWNIVAMWSWDVECDTCAICRVQVMGKLE